jgi:diaminopimelate epimerase
MFYCPYYFSPFIVSSFVHFLVFVYFLEPNQISEPSVGTDYEINAQVATFSLGIDFFQPAHHDHLRMPTKEIAAQWTQALM